MIVAYYISVTRHTHWYSGYITFDEWQNYLQQQKEIQRKKQEVVDAKGVPPAGETTGDSSTAAYANLLELLSNDKDQLKPSKSNEKKSTAARRAV